MKINSKNFAILLGCIAIIISFSGCLKNFDVATLVEEPTAYEVPEILEWSEKTHPPEVLPEYEGAYIDVNPVFGEKVRIKGMEYIAQLILQASKNPDRIVDIETSRRGYDNKILIYNAQDELLGDFEISSEYMVYARLDKDSPLFLLPEYAYYTLENCLLQIGSSLVEPLENWTRHEQPGDERAQYDEQILELRLAHDIKTVLVEKYGLSEAYFLNYNIYTTAEYSTTKIATVRVYAFIGYAAYSTYEGERCEVHLESTDEAEILACEECKPKFFAPDYHIETAAKMVYTFTDQKYYRLTEYSEPAAYNKEYPSSLESRIRAIFPFEYMKGVMKAIDDTSNIHLDIHRQALDYLRVSGQGDMIIDD